MWFYILVGHILSLFEHRVLQALSVHLKVNLDYLLVHLDILNIIGVEII